MTTALETLGDATRTRLWDWSVANHDTTRLLLPGDGREIPPNDPENPITTSYVRATEYVDIASQLAIGATGKREYRGSFYVEVLAPVGNGDTYVRSLAGSVADYFRNGNDLQGALTYEEPEPRFSPLPEEDSDLIRYEVRIPFYYQFNPGSDVTEVSYPVVTYEATAHGLSAGDAVRVSGTSWVKARADSESTLAVGIVSSVPTADIAHISLGPTAKVTAHGKGAGGTKLFLSQVTPGLLTSAAITSGIEQLVATVIDANTLRLHDYTVQEK